MAELREAGAVAVSDDGVCVMSSAVMRRALEYAKNFDMPVIQHAEDHELTANAEMNEGAVSTRLGLSGWPRVAEDIIIARDVLLAEYVSARYHAAHISTRGAVRILREAKSRGLQVTCEVTPHHLLLTDAAVIGYDTACKVNPPLARGRRRGGAARGARRRHHRRHRHRSRTALAAGKGLRVPGSVAGPDGARAVFRASVRSRRTGPWARTSGRCAVHAPGADRGHRAPCPARGRARRARARRPRSALGAGEDAAPVEEPQHAVPRARARGSRIDDARRRRHRLRSPRGGRRERAGESLPRPGRRHAIRGRSLGRRGQHQRRGRVHDRHDRLPGSADRSVLHRADRHHDGAAYRQHRHQRRAIRKASTASRAWPASWYAR